MLDIKSPTKDDLRFFGHELPLPNPLLPGEGFASLWLTGLAGMGIASVAALRLLRNDKSYNICNNKIFNIFVLPFEGKFNCNGLLSDTILRAGRHFFASLFKNIFLKESMHGIFYLSI
jgi:hypothetical protein